MSCFIVDHKSVLSAFRTLGTSDYCGNGGKYALYSTVYQKRKIDLDYLDKLARKIWVINHKSVRARYENRRTGFIPLHPGPFRGDILPAIQLLKTLQCIAYQCDECPKEYPAMDELRAITEELKDRIISNLPEYQAAQWG